MDGEANQFCFASTGTANVLDVALKRWTPENPDSNYPCVRLDFYNNDFTDFSVYNASYLKIQNVNLEYKFPKYIVDKTKIFGNTASSPLRITCVPSPPIPALLPNHGAVMLSKGLP